MTDWRSSRCGMVLTVVFTLVAGCGDDNGGDGSCVTPGRCVELRLWRELPGFGPGQSIDALDTTAYIAGRGGVVALDLNSGEQRSLPLPDLGAGTVAVVRASRGRPGVLAIGVPATDVGMPARLLISENGGETWRDGTPPDAGQSALQRESLVFAPGSEAGGAGLLFANIGCQGVALSDDLGQTWRTLTAPSDLCVESPLAVSGSGRTLWHGTEFGFDIVELNKRDITARGNTPAGPWTNVLAGPDLLSNHDPNVIVADPQQDESMYVGAELSVMHLSDASDFEYRIGSVEAEQLPYFRAFWFDPAQSDHILAGGGFSGGDAGLYESFSGGFDAARVTLPELPDPDAIEIMQGIVAVPGTRDIVCLVATNFHRPDGRTFLLRGTVRTPR
jgi:hypothetical protein